MSAGLPFDCRLMSRLSMTTDHPTRPSRPNGSRAQPRCRAILQGERDIASLLYTEHVNAISVGRDLARLRRKAGLTQSALAGLLGTTQTAISRTESGGALPSLALIERWSSACGQSLTLTFGSAKELPSRAERRRRVRQVLGDFEFNPWDREPTEAEAESLISDGLTRERFQR